MEPERINMDKMIGPTGVMLVGAAFVFLILCMSSEAQQLSASDSLIKMMEFHPNSVDSQQESKAWTPELFGNTAGFPWAFRMLGPNRPGFMPRSEPVQETISLGGDHPEEQLQDLKAFNAIQKRDVVYSEMQNWSAKSSGLANALEVCITGKGQDKKEYSEYGLGDNSLEQFVDNRFHLGPGNGNGDDILSRGNSGSNLPGNYMNIDVSGVTVSAINTVEGGSAVATSNIVIKPVQLIIYHPEVEEKLR
jgi:hypothetical protein